MEESREDQKEPAIDFPGALLLLLTNSLLIYAMNQIPHLGWSHRIVLTTISLSGVSLALLVITELKTKAPILSFSLFRDRLFSASMLSLFFITSTQSAIGFLMPFYLQNIMGFPPSQMGWIIIAGSVMIVMVAPIAGGLSDRLGSRFLCTLGSALIVVGQFFIASLNVGSSIPRIIFSLALSGLGWAIFNSPNQSAILGSVPMDKAGTASGMTATTARTGGAMGIALSATLFTYGLTAAGLTPLQIESPQSWSASPEIFVRSFNHTVHIINAFTLLSVFFSAVRGARRV
jgi:MFS family permease